MNAFKPLAALLICTGMSACSVGMAMSGKPAPNLGAVQQGVSRGEVEMHLGQPVQTATQPNGAVISTYEYEIGNEPSAGRAVGHAAMDVLTFGAWEIIGTPIEGVTGDKYRAVITYGTDGKVANISTQKASS
jgi:hypothetical protein